MGCAKMKKLLCHGLAAAMVVSLTATASDSHGIGQQCGSKESKTCEENNYD